MAPVPIPSVCLGCHRQTSHHRFTEALQALVPSDRYNRLASEPGPGLGRWGCGDREIMECLKTRLNRMAAKSPLGGPRQGLVGWGEGYARGKAVSKCPARENLLSVPKGGVWSAMGSTYNAPL